MGRGLVYLLTLAFVGILALLTVRSRPSIFGGRGALGPKEER
jgi:hypothetical protein